MRFSVLCMLFASVVLGAAPTLPPEELPACRKRSRKSPCRLLWGGKMHTSPGLLCRSMMSGGAHDTPNTLQTLRMRRPGCARARSSAALRQRCACAHAWGAHRVSAYRRQLCGVRLIASPGAMLHALTPQCRALLPCYAVAQRSRRRGAPRPSHAPAARASAAEGASGAAHASRRTFRFVPYGESYVGDAGVHSICCDGLVQVPLVGRKCGRTISSPGHVLTMPLTPRAQGAALHLTHWANNATPSRYYADTSAEITARFVASDEAAAYADAIIVNNHYDTDGCAPFHAPAAHQAALGPLAVR